MKINIVDRLLLLFDKCEILAFSPGELFKTKRSRKLFILLWPLWIIYVILFVLLTVFIGLPTLFICWAIYAIIESLERIKNWINKPNE